MDGFNAKKHHEQQLLSALLILNKTKQDTKGFPEVQIDYGRCSYCVHRP